MKISDFAIYSHRYITESSNESSALSIQKISDIRFGNMLFLTDVRSPIH